MESVIAFFRRIAAFFTGIITMIASLFGFGGSEQFEPVLEERYAENGAYETVCVSFPTEDEKTGTITVWYPEGAETCPAVFILNGTGGKAEWSPEYLARFASFGLIAVGTGDTDPGDGYSTQQALAFILEQNADPESVLYGRVDTEKLGITGYSQGGAGALRAASLLPCADAFCTVAAVSPSNEARAESRGWGYDPERITVPVLLVSGTGQYDNGDITSLEMLSETFGKLSGPKAMARRTGSDHSTARTDSAGYVVAWMLWQLSGDAEAAKVFTGDAPEISSNPDWQDVSLDL